MKNQKKKERKNMSKMKMKKPKIKDSIKLSAHLFFLDDFIFFIFGKNALNFISFDPIVRLIRWQQCRLQFKLPRSAYLFNHFNGFLFFQQNFSLIFFLFLIRSRRILCIFVPFLRSCVSLLVGVLFVECSYTRPTIDRK